MVKSRASTPEEYLSDLPDDRASIVHAVRSTIVDHLPDGFEETMTFGMLGYVVSLDRYRDTYNGQPLSAIALANQKNHVVVYLMGIYADEDQRNGSSMPGRQPARSSTWGSHVSGSRRWTTCRSRCSGRPSHV